MVKSQMKIFITEKSCEDNLESTGQALLGMPDGVDAADKSPIESSSDQKVKQNPEGDSGDSGTPHSISIQIEPSDEVIPKSPSTNSPGKKSFKNKENHPQLVVSKSESRMRQKPSPELKGAHVANAGGDHRWYISEKLETDLPSLKWLSGLDNNTKSESSPKGRGHNLNSSESDIFPIRGGTTNSSNELYSKPHSLFKSSSSSHLPHVRGNGSQANRQLKFNGNGSVKSPSVLPALPQCHMPYSISNVPYGRYICVCGGNSGKRANRAESCLSLTEDVETPEGLSWRRLHMSRAKLKATATTSELLSGFAMVAMVELQINKPTAVPEWLFVLFAVCTTILVSVHIFALMISTYLLPNIDAVSKLHVSSLVTESPHDRMKSFIELAWAFSTILGLFLFLVEIAILCWVKFWDYSFTAAMSATMIIIPVLILFVAFAMHFYHSLVVIKCKTSVTNMQELENMKRQLDNVSPA